MSRIAWTWIGILFLFCSCKKYAETPKLTIAAAANMQFAIGELAEAFTETNGIETQLVVGSSGNLTAQIVSGAPFDVFLSADIQYPLSLFEKGVGYQKPEIFAYGQLVLWTCNSGINPDLSSLTDEQIAHIAIPNPELAPYGRAAREVLSNRRLYEHLLPKLVYGESIAQTNQFIRTGAAEIGFTALSVVLAPQLRQVGRWTKLPEYQYTPIAQGILILGNQEKVPDRALKFYTFLKSEAGRKILTKYGYLSTNE